MLMLRTTNQNLQQPGETSLITKANEETRLIGRPIGTQPEEEPDIPLSFGEEDYEDVTLGPGCGLVAALPSGASSIV